MIDISLFPMLPSMVKYKETIHNEAERRSSGVRLVYSVKTTKRDRCTPFSRTMPFIHILLDDASD